jgi:hypothetical protein
MVQISCRSASLRGRREWIGVEQGDQQQCEAKEARSQDGRRERERSLRTRFRWDGLAGRDHLAEYFIGQGLFLLDDFWVVGHLLSFDLSALWLTDAVVEKALWCGAINLRPWADA